jgi:hypothetical protein
MKTVHDTSSGSSPHATSDRPNALDADLEIESDSNGLPKPSGHARMPWFLLAFWILSLCFYAWYLRQYALPDLQEWLKPKP